LDVWVLRFASGQADRHTDTDQNNSTPASGEVKMRPQQEL